MELFLTILLAVIQSISFLFLIEKTLLNKIQKKTLKQFLIIAVYATFVFCLFFCRSDFRVIFNFVLQSLVASLLFSESIWKTTVSVFFLSFLNFCVEFIFVFILFFLVHDYSTWLAIPISLLQFFIVYFFLCRKEIIHLKKLLLENEKKNILIGLIIFLLIFSFFEFLYHLDFYTESLSSLMFVLFLFSISIFYLCVVGGSYARLKKMFELLQEESQMTGDLIEEYRVFNHERKNQLILIRSMIDSKDVVEYIDSLIEEKPPKLEFIMDFCYFSIPVLRGFLSYKFREIQDKNIKLYVQVSKGVRKIPTNFLSDRCLESFILILGVFIDNAREAVLEIPNGQILFEAFLEDDVLHIQIANSFKDAIDLDSILKDHKSTKGSGRGHGLFLVEKILNQYSNFVNRTELIGDLFVQRLEVHAFQEDEDGDSCD